LKQYKDIKVHKWWLFDIKHWKKTYGTKKRLWYLHQSLI